MCDESYYQPAASLPKRLVLHLVEALLVARLAAAAAVVDARAVRMKVAIVA